MGMLISLLVLSFLIFFHELGHFLAARWLGVKVEVFSIGFGKKVFSKKWGDTEYCLSVIPLGGYVQMKGQDDSDPTKVSYDDDSYNTKTPFERILILFAGPFANFLLAFFLYIAIGSLGVLKFAPEVGNISENSAAQKAGLVKNDVVLAINQNKITTWDDIKPLVVKSEGSMELIIKRGEKNKAIILTPIISESKTIFGETIQERLIGISPSGKTMTVYFEGLDAVTYAVDETIRSTQLIVTSLQKIIEGVVSPKEMGGIISIVKVTSDAADVGIVALFMLTALISVNLGVINLFPIPALDGGHIMFNLYEMGTGKPPSEAIYMRLTYIGWGLLLTLMAFTIINDIVRFSGGYQ